MYTSSSIILTLTTLLSLASSLALPSDNPYQSRPAVGYCTLTSSTTLAMPTTATSTTTTIITSIITTTYETTILQPTQSAYTAYGLDCPANRPQQSQQYQPSQASQQSQQSQPYRTPYPSQQSQKAEPSRKV